MTEQDYYEAFGLESPVEEPAVPDESQEGDAGDAAAEEPAQEPGEPAEDPAREPEQEPAAKPSSNPAVGKQAVDPAGLRRQHSQELERLRAENEQRLNQMVQGLGLKNPANGAPITTFQEYQGYQRAAQEQQVAQFKKLTGMSDEQYRQFVDGLPEVQQARQAQAAVVQAERAAREQRAKANMDEQIAMIGRLDPGITDVASLTKHESYDRVYELVKKGYDVYDAYRIANYDTLVSKAVAAAQQQVRNQSAGKRHLSPTSQRGAGAVDVPADVAGMYRRLNPNATDAEIRQHYAAFVKQ